MNFETKLEEVANEVEALVTDYKDLKETWTKETVFKIMDKNREVITFEFSVEDLLHIINKHCRHIIQVEIATNKDLEQLKKEVEEAV